MECVVCVLCFQVSSVFAVVSYAVFHANAQVGLLSYLLIRYQALHQQLKAPKRLTALMAYICYQDSVEVQIEAIRIGAELVQVQTSRYACSLSLSSRFQ
jgi:hypothetical protein